MIFQHSWEKVLDGSKTQTRRRVKPGETMLSCGVRYVLDAYGKTKYEAGNTYAVQPGRGKPAVARIRILSIRREDVRYISDEDVKAEGFADAVDFWITWTVLHDPKFYKEGHHAQPEAGTRKAWLPVLDSRPAELYDAWAIEFEVA